MVAKGRKQLVGLLTDDPKVVLAGRRPDRRRPEPAEADDHARPRHLLLLERGARPLDRHGGRRRRPRPRRARRCTSRCRTAPSRPASSRARSSTTPKAPASAPEMESRMNAMTAPFAAGVTITELPPTTRISLRLADREAAAAALGLELPTRIGTRAVGGRAQRPLPRPRRVADRGAGGRRRRARRRRSPTSRRACRSAPSRSPTARSPIGSKARPSSTCSPPAARSTSRGCRSATAPAPSSTPPRSC